MDGKNGLEPVVTEATAAPARAQNADDGDAVAGPPLRFSAKRKLAVVQRLLRGELDRLRAHVFLHGQRPGTYGVYYEYPNPLPDMPSTAEGRRTDCTSSRISTSPLPSGRPRSIRATSGQ